MKSLVKRFFTWMYFVKLFFSMRYKFIKTECKRPKVITAKETVKAIKKKRLSIVRYGDGEFTLIDGHNRGFQPYSEELAKRLREILNSRDEKIAIAIPNIYRYSELRKMIDKSRYFWLKFLVNNECIMEINCSNTFYDSLVTRPYLSYRNKENIRYIIESFKQIWSHMEIIMVEGKGNYYGIYSNLFKGVKSIQRVICPRVDAFSIYEELLHALCEYENSKLILISLGHTATVLAYDLAKLGYWAIDIGQLDYEYNCFLQKLDDKSVEFEIEINQRQKEEFNSQVVLDLTNR